MAGRRATCACGSLEVRCTGEPIKVSLCHCLDCQRRTGSTYGIAAFFRREDIETQGMARSYTRPSDSGHPVTFHFCPDCGSTVYWIRSASPMSSRSRSGHSRSGFRPPPRPRSPSAAIHGLPSPAQRRANWV